MLSGVGCDDFRRSRICGPMERSMLEYAMALLGAADRLEWKIINIPIVLIQIAETHDDPEVIALIRDGDKVSYEVSGFGHVVQGCL